MATVVNKAEPHIAADTHVKSKLEKIDEQLEANKVVLETIATNTEA